MVVRLESGVSVLRWVKVSGVLAVKKGRVEGLGVCVCVVNERSLLVGVRVEGWWEEVDSEVWCLSRGLIVR